MSGAPQAIDDEDLGGGFRLARSARAGSVIIAGALQPTGVKGLISPVTLNARDRVSLFAWADEQHPGVGQRLRGVDQVHGATVVSAEQLRGGRRVDADGVCAGSPDDVPVVLAADCAPVWLADPRGKILALVHAGWRGIAAGVIEAGVRACAERGAMPQRLVAAVGPHLGACCFEVGPEVAVQFPGHTRPATTLVVERLRSDSVTLDAASAIVARLSAAGVNDVNVARACTRCRADILHSYRRNGKGGPLMGAIGIPAAGGAR